MSKTNKRKKWIKFRHNIIRSIVYLPVKLYSALKYHAKIITFKHPKKQNYLILYNHQTDGDELFLYLVFKGSMYPLATEDLFYSGLASRLLEYAFAPISFNKAGNNVSSLMQCMRIAKEGASISISAEGNRTYSGQTEYIKPSIVKMVRALKLPVAFLTFTGGYGVQPRWSNSTRKGKMTAAVTSVLKKEEYDNMTDEQLYDTIERRLYVNEANDSGFYKGNKRAEYLERLFYTCPKCGLTTWKSEGNNATCLKCGMTVNYGEKKEITGKDFPYKYALDWYKAQNEYIKTLNYDDLPSSPMYEDDVRFSQVVKLKRKKLISATAKAKLYKDKITIEYIKFKDKFKSKEKSEKVLITFPFEDTSSAVVLGRNKLSFNSNGIFQLKGDFSFNAVKYVNFYYKFVNYKKGEMHYEFLGF